MAGKLGGRITAGQMREAARGDQVRAINPSRNWGALGLSLAQVRDVFYEELKVNLLVVSGEADTFLYEGVDLTLPGVGRRHFFGAMPERGDFCLVGWAVQESSGIANSRTPIILQWMPPPPWMGHEWLMHQGYAPGEGMDTPQQRALLLGVSERTRYKMRHMSPGNIMASSSQGSDMVLDEGVLLTNRRANEIRLRDQDQAFIVRSLQQFHAMAGARIYAGMVQRDARFLPTTMFSDGIWWDSPLQMGDDGPLTQGQLATSPFARDYLTPGQIFQRDDPTTNSDFETEKGNTVAEALDPFDFLKWGLFITGDGNRMFAQEADTLYGGKAIYRVGVTPGPPQTPIAVWNAVYQQDEINPDSLTEYRIEVTHTSKGVLPITEQTDGFDAERYPDHNIEDDPTTYPSTSPFIEWVLGSVVGNDAFSVDGLTKYGLPLKPVIFQPNGSAAPSLVSALNSNLGEHAATLLKVRPPVGNRPASFTSFTKAGNFKASVQGNAPWSIEVFAATGTKFQAGGGLSITANALDMVMGAGANVSSLQGAVRIYGGGRSSTGTAGQEAAGASTDPNNAPSVLLEGRYNVNLEAGARVGIQAPTVDITNTSQVNVRAQTGIEMMGGESITMHSNTLTESIAGKASYEFAGPSMGDPTGGALREVSIIGTPATGGTGGTVDSYYVEFGDLLEVFTYGNRRTRINIGDNTIRISVGKWLCQSGENILGLSNDRGFAVNLPLGDMTSSVQSGEIRQTASGFVGMRSLRGNMALEAANNLRLKAIGPSGLGGVVMCGSDRDPLTGITYADLGLLPRGQNLRFQ